MRADVFLVDAGHASTRSQAQRLIAAGVQWRLSPLAPWVAVAKNGDEIPAGSEVQLLDAAEARYLSRGGLKLEGALAQVGLAVAGLRCLDVGQSTGGFTDCLLQAGAKHVVGVDVGHDQLHAQLRADPAVTCLEGINCRALSVADLGAAFPEDGFDLIVGDVSFISLTLILPRLPALLAPSGDLLLLVKPQFEVGPGNIGRGGIVRDPALYHEVEHKLRDCAKMLGLTIRAWLDSPITGGDGNREFFIWLNK